VNRLAGFLACVCAAFALFYVSARTPPPLGVTAPDALFSAGRALTDIAAVAQTPHPVGSPAHDRVKTYLVDRMAHMGLAPRLQTDVSLNSRTISAGSYISGAKVTNLVGVLPGKDRTLPALALMAHYDTVPGSPGAADDTTGVAVALEVMRVLALHGPPARDVDLILTDGEELGLLGARSFFFSDPAARQIGFVINLEARGGGGRAAMFQTGYGDGADIDLFARSTRTPSSTSLLPLIYRFLPNDTDFTVSLAHGVPGYNLAFIGREFDYHSPSSTVAALDKGSVQHMGDEILGPATALAFSSVLPQRAPDVVFADVFGLGLVHYPPSWGWLILVLCAALIVTATIRTGPRARISASSVGIGFLAGLIILILDGALLSLARQATGAGGGWFAYRSLLARFPVFEVALGLCALAGVLFVAALAGARGRSPGTWIGFLVLGLIAACALQALAPLTAFVLAWPLLAASVCAALTDAGASEEPLAWGAFTLVAVAALAWVGNFFHLMLEGLDLAPVCALFAWMAAMIVWPLAAPPPIDRGGAFAPRLTTAVLLLVVGLGLAGWLRVTSPWSPRHPRAVAPQIIETNGGVWRASLPPLDAWTRSFLGNGSTTTLTDVAGEPGLIATRQAGVSRSRPGISLTALPAGGETLTVNFDPAAYSVALDVMSNVPLSEASFQGLAAEGSFRPGLWTHIRWRGQAGESVSLTLRGAKPGSVTVRYSLFEARWPARAAPIPPLDLDHMFWGDPPPVTVMAGKLSGAL
jgi:hypothetical protein